MAGDIVNWPNVERYYGGNPDLLEDYRKIAASRECPFCPEGIKRQGFSVEKKELNWVAVRNRYPYPHTCLHLLLIPRRHIVHFYEFTNEELIEFGGLIRNVASCYPKGYGLALREGEIGGVTLYHLHWHFIVPEIGPDGQIPVNFGIG